MKKIYWKSVGITGNYTGEELKTLSALYDEAFSILVNANSEIAYETLLFPVIFELFRQGKDVDVNDLFLVMKNFPKRNDKIITLGDEEYLTLTFIEFYNQWKESANS